MRIRPFTNDDAEETAKMIAKTLRISNSKDYPEQYIEFNIASHSADELIKAANERHMYVACDGERIIGTGGIAVSPKAFSLRYLSCPNIREMVWEEKSSGRLKKMSTF